MRPLETPRRWALGAISVGLLIGVLVAVAGGVQAQDRVQGDVLLNESSLIGFDNAEDTTIEEVDERPASRRVQVEGVALRGPDTFTTPGSQGGQRDYLLSLSASGGTGIGEEVLARLDHGRIHDARLQVSYQGGCNSPDGELTVRAIANRSWSPFDVGWEDTTRADGTLDVTGPLLARTPISPEASQNNANVGCNEATLPLQLEPLGRVLTGELGGIGLFWNGQQELNVTTLDGAASPVLDLNFTTNGPTVHNVSVEDGFPVVVDTGERFSLVVNASDPQGLPDDAVTLNVTANGTGKLQSSLEATRSGQVFVATHTFASEDEGLYDLTAFATDSDGWIDQASPNRTPPHIVADGTAPTLHAQRLAGSEPGATVARDQGARLPVQANVSDLSCEGGRDPCGSWKVTWRQQTLASGNLTPEQRIETNLTLPRPGNTTARLVVQDAAGHRNRSTTWQLVSRDTHPPGARPVEGTDLAPGQATTIENGTPLDVHFEIEDALPVEARLLLEGPPDLDRQLPAPDEDGRVEATFTSIPQGDYEAALLLDDGVHTNRVDFGQLTVAPEGAPEIQVPLPSVRIAPGQAVPVRIEDRNLEPNRTTVSAQINGLRVQPQIETQTTAEGQRLEVHLGDLSHGDEVNVTVRARDAQGLSSSARARLTVDALAPRLTEPANRSWHPPGAQLRFDAEDPGGGQATLRVDAPRTTLRGEVPLTVPVDRVVGAPGQLSAVTVGLEDDLGNEDTRRIHVGVDDDPPTVATEFTRDGLILVARDDESGVHRLSVALGINGAPLNRTQVFQESPTRYAVPALDLSRGDEVRLAVTVRDEVGRTATLGTRSDPALRVVPDRPPTASLERVGPSVAATGTVSWNASDPDEDPLEVELTIEAPNGSTRTRSVEPSGRETIEPEQRGRYDVRLQASSAGNASSSRTFFYLAPEGRVTQVSGVPDEIDPDRRLVFSLSFPAEPERVFVTAVDEANASIPANVDVQGTEATATFDALPEGEYDLQATVVYPGGAVEQVHVATIQSEQPISDQLGGLLVPLLVALAILLVVAIVAVWYRRRQEEDEDVEASGSGPAR